MPGFNVGVPTPRVPRSAGRAGAIALAVVSWGCRLGGIFMAALTVILCFAGLSAKLNLVGFIVDLSRTLPGAIAGYGVITSPFGGVFRLDFALVAAALFVADYLCQRASRGVRPGR